MNVNLLIANAVMGKVEQQTTIDRHLLLDNSEFMLLFTNKINAHEPMESITNTLVEFVNNNY
jgi:hypothetical protein